MVWKALYAVMGLLSSRFLQRAFWWCLRKSRVADILCDEGFLKLQLLGVTGERYSLSNGGINSWILWQRLNAYSPLMSICCDKLAVRSFVKDRIGSDYLVPLCQLTRVLDNGGGGGLFVENPDEIDVSLLPSSFVLKLNNGSGMNLIVKDKAQLDWEAAKKKMRQWLKSNYSNGSREWQYENVENLIICEEMIPTPDGEPPSDYKIMCSDGIPLYIWVDTNRFSGHKRNVFTLDWHDEGVTIAYDRCQESIPRPKNLDLMLSLAGKLSKGFQIVRVDFYNVDGRIYFGELTFTSGCGIEITRPFSFSQEAARKITHPKCQKTLKNDLLDIT